MDSIDYWAGEVRRLEAAIVAARQRALAAPPCASFFVFFSSQKDAAVAAQANLHPEDGNSFRVTEAPGPEEVRALFCVSSRSLTPYFFVFVKARNVIRQSVGDACPRKHEFAGSIWSALRKHRLY